MMQSPRAARTKVRIDISRLLPGLVLIVGLVEPIVACTASDADEHMTGPPDPVDFAGSYPGGDASYAGNADEGGAGGFAQVFGGASGAVSVDPGLLSDAGAGVFAEAGASGGPERFVPAPHAPFPSVAAHGGPVLEDIDLVSIYFGTDALQTELENFNSWIVTSDYWKQVGAEYGVFPGHHRSALQFSAPASPISDVEVGTWLDQQIGNGSLPKPSAETLFALFYPASTRITTGGSASCSGFAGLHGSASVANPVFTGNVPFVVIPRCSFSVGDELIVATNVASHEYMEAATDPLATSDPAWVMDGEQGQPLEAWQMLTGLEVADLCANQSYDVIDGFTVQDIWSNSAARTGNNPCQPSDPKHPFFTVSADATIFHARPGDTLQIPATAWSNMSAPDWSISIDWSFSPDSDFDGHATLSRTTVNNGDHVTAIVTVPVNLPTEKGRSVYRFTVDSIDPINPNFAHPWPIMVVVP